MKSTDRNITSKGIICGILTGICWGVSGVFGQFLFENYGIETYWLVPVRLTVSGALLVAWILVKDREETFKLIRNKKDLLWTVAAGVFGTMMFQLTFFGTVQRSNAGTATILQYLAPAFVLIYMCVKCRRKPSKREIAALAMALAGIFLISTHGRLDTLAMTPSALMWGIACAFFMFLATVIPADLLTRHPGQVVTGISILSGGIVLSLILKPWEYSVQLNVPILISLFFIIIGGSAAAYLFYAQAIMRIGSEKASLCATVEPVAATLLAAVWLHTSFPLIDLAGFALIIAMVIILNSEK